MGALLLWPPPTLNCSVKFSSTVHLCGLFLKWWNDQAQLLCCDNGKTSTINHCFVLQFKPLSIKISIHYSQMPMHQHKIPVLPSFLPCVTIIVTVPLCSFFYHHLSSLPSLLPLLYVMITIFAAIAMCFHWHVSWSDKIHTNQLYWKIYTTIWKKWIVSFLHFIFVSLYFFVVAHYSQIGYRIYWMMHTIPFLWWLRPEKAIDF